MTINDSARPDAELFERLRAVWRRHDPVPADLVDNVLVALATRDLGLEYATLTMLESESLAGVRGETDVAVLEFNHGDSSVMLRVSPLGDGRRRVDGWIAPASPLLVRLQQDHDDFTTVASNDGRFEFADVPARRTRMWLQPDPASVGSVPTRRGFTTEPFDL
jgi:hypothetical protein